MKRTRRPVSRRPVNYRSSTETPLRTAIWRLWRGSFAVSINCGLFDCNSTIRSQFSHNSTPIQLRFNSNSKANQKTILIGSRGIFQKSQFWIRSGTFFKNLKFESENLKFKIEKSHFQIGSEISFSKSQFRFRREISFSNLVRIVFPKSQIQICNQKTGSFSPPMLEQISKISISILL